jgi:hypothetical protein
MRLFLVEFTKILRAPSTFARTPDKDKQVNAERR